MAANLALGVPAKAGSGWMQRALHGILGVPLVAKLVGANVLIVATAILVQSVAFSGRRAELIAVVVALAAALIVNLFLVRVALRPIEQLEQLAQRVSEGEFDARGAPSPFADKELSRLRRTVNDLLDSLAAERKRIHDLGAHVVQAQDVERAKASRELHDSIAQTLAAVRFQLAAAGREDSISETRNRLAAANGMISAAMEEIMSVSHALHSRVAEDLGIEAALGTLVRQAKERSRLEVTLRIMRHGRSHTAIPAAVSATLYRVAEEALRELELDTGSRSAGVDLRMFDDNVQLAVTIDGGKAKEMVILPGLNSVRDRVLLAGGKMDIDIVPTGGMKVTAELRILRAAS